MASSRNNNSSNDMSPYPYGKLPKQNKPIIIQFDEMCKHFKCQECQQYPSTEVYSCIGGHPYCHFCFKNNGTCRICNLQLTIDFWAIGVCNRYSAICPYPGCGKVLRIAELTFHSYDCEFRTSECFETTTDSEGRLVRCEDVFPAEDLFKHLREHHGYT